MPGGDDGGGVGTGGGAAWVAEGTHREGNGEDTSVLKNVRDGVGLFINAFAFVVRCFFLGLVLASRRLWPQLLVLASLYCC